MNRPLVIAHRGSSATCAENTVAAFAAAHRDGADMVELDARRTVEGEVVVHHDALLPSGTPIHACRVQDLPSHVPTLSAALAACEGMQVNIELKNSPFDPDFDPAHGIVAAVTAVVAEAGWYDRVLLSSFNLDTVRAVRVAGPALATAWLTLPGAGAAAVVDASGGIYDAWHPHDRGLEPADVASAHAAGLRVNVWTVDDPTRMVELASWGVDGVVTNLPALARRTLG